MPVTYEVIDVSGIEVVRPLFDKLMRYQQEKVPYGKKLFDHMTMEFRVYSELKKNKFKATHVILVRDGETLIGFAYSAIDQKDNGILKLFYLEPAYRGQGIGHELFLRSMVWIGSFSTKRIQIFVTRGNDGAMKFYESHGFKRKKSVFFGMIHQLEQENA